MANIQITWEDLILRAPVLNQINQNLGGGVLIALRALPITLMYDEELRSITLVRGSQTWLYIRITWRASTMYCSWVPRPTN